jgi:Tat protein secretion system quality control protein TatD with DNase activity
VSETVLAASPDDHEAYAVAVVANALANVSPAQRRPFLRHLLLAAGSGLRVIVGRPSAAEDVYSIADQIVAEAARVGRR